MKPRYAIINQYDRDKFEKEWQLPYGYASVPIFMKSQRAKDALDGIAKIRGNGNMSELIVEKISDEGRELYYRI